MAELVRTEYVESFEDLRCTICWDDGEDIERELASGVYPVCGGEWRREADGMWRFWEDPIIAAELAITAPDKREAT